MMTALDRVKASKAKCKRHRDNWKRRAEEAIAILRECEQAWGCECPYCDRNFGNDFESHAEDCRIGRFLRQEADHDE